MLKKQKDKYRISPNIGRYFIIEIILKKVWSSYIRGLDIRALDGANYRGGRQTAKPCRFDWREEEATTATTLLITLRDHFKSCPKA